MALEGLHHITAITADAPRNVDFYARLLGLRLVKKTVNFDQPDVYHLYYGDHTGRPGTILTFFSWPGAYPGRRGTEQATAVAWAVPQGSMDFWKARFEEHALPANLDDRFGEEVLIFTDPDGLEGEVLLWLSHDAEVHPPGTPATGYDH